jgi:hypothetical protein
MGRKTFGSRKNFDSLHFSYNFAVPLGPEGYFLVPLCTIWYFLVPPCREYHILVHMCPEGYLAVFPKQHLQGEEEHSTSMFACFTSPTHVVHMRSLLTKYCTVPVHLGPPLSLLWAYCFQS